jgi:hypothetical protein
MSTKSPNRAFLVFSILLIAPIITLSASALQAANSDVWTTHSGADPTAVGVPFTITVGYGNNGPDAATSAYINSTFIAPMGLDVFIDDLLNGSGAIYDSVQASAEGTDTLGNAPLLFWDDYLCEELLFQLQRNDGDPDANPVEGLDPGVSAAFSYDVTIPMESPNTGTIEIIQPASLAQAWTASNPARIFVLQAAALNTYARGSCEKWVGTEEEDICEYIDDNCFGARVSQLDVPIEAEFELVNDGTADPTLGCEVFLDFTPGNIALLRRGVCEFGVKGFNAEQAGAVAVFMVNDGRCADDPPSDQCVFNMAPGALGALVTIPITMFAQADGEPVITAVESGTTVRGVFGGASQLSANGYSFLADSGDTDPDPENDESYWNQMTYGVGCVYDLVPTSLSFPANGGNGQVELTSTAECYWDATTEAPWVSLSPPVSGTGNGTVDYQVDANVGPGRAAVVRIANQPHYVTQEAGNGCTYTITPTETLFTASGGDGSIEITTQAGCDWTALTTEPWMTLTSTGNGTGSATVTFSVIPNQGSQRTGAVLVADQIHQVIQSTPPFFSDGFETGDTSGWDRTSP